MRARTLLGVLAGLLLLVPLLGIALYVRTQLQTHVPEERPISPVLPFEERLRLVTYERECGKDKKCEPPLGCLPVPGRFKSYCTDSECETDVQCREGFTCQVMWTSAGPLIRSCIPVGVRQEGQRCTSLPTDKEEACGPGLICGANWCGRPCKKGEATDCPEGFFCEEATPGPLCLPTCEERECPEGQHCVAFSRGTSVCAVVHGNNCREQGCPSGEKCSVQHREDRPGEVWMRCFTPCGAGKPPCPEGRLCHRDACRMPCNPEGPEVCYPGYRCGQLEQDGPWVCRFDRSRDSSQAEEP